MHVEYPVIATNNGVKIRPELMESERLYHCLFKDKLMLFFKDSQDFLNCYEIEERELIELARKTPRDALSKILENYVRRQD